VKKHIRLFNDSADKTAEDIHVELVRDAILRTNLTTSHANALRTRNGHEPTSPSVI
jgi:hypothetical protein